MKRKGFNRFITALATAIILIFTIALVGCSPQAAVGIDKMKINADGELVVTYTDGSKANLGKIVGEDGADGAKGDKGDKGDQGLPGIKGKDGKDGLNGLDGKDGTLVITGADASVSAAAAKGIRSAVSIVSNFTSTSKPVIGTPTVEEYAAGGSGVIYKLDRDSRSAFIITNYHVVYDSKSDTANGISDNIEVFVYGSEYMETAIPATYVGGSMYYDLAVLYVENSELLMGSFTDEVTVGSSDNVHLGSTAIAIGNPEGGGIAVSSGVVSVDSEYMTMYGADDKTEVTFRVVRVDTPVNHGNSGGGLYNINGELIGIVNAKIVDADVENIGYAIPVDLVTAVVDNILYYCYGTDCENVMKPTVGITITTAASVGVFDTDTGNVCVRETIVVQEVVSGSPSDGNFREGDEFVSATLNGVTYGISRRHHLIDMILRARIGDTIEYKVIRDGVETEVYITITESAVSPY